MSEPEERRPSRIDPYLREPRSDVDSGDLAARVYDRGLRDGSTPAERDDRGPGRRRRRGGRGGRGGRREETVVPDAEFSSYYGRPVLKPPVWDWRIAGYLFTGGLAAGSSVLGAGAAVTRRPHLRRAGLLSTLAALLASTGLLVWDLGRPERFHHMLRVAKPTSPMSVGTWVLTFFGLPAGVAAVAELVPRRWRHLLPARVLRAVQAPAAVSAAALAPALASYTSVLLSQTAVPAWKEVHGELPFVFTGSAAAASGGLGMALAPLDEAGPARAFAVYGAAQELVASRVMEHRLGIVREAYDSGSAHRYRTWSERLTAAGLVGTLVAAPRSRAGAVASGAALMAGSLLQRLGVFAAGVASTKDPKYVVVPQRARLEARKTAEAARGNGASPDRAAASSAGA